MQRKQNLASAIGILKENLGNHVFFRDKKASIWKKKLHTLLCILLFFRITAASLSLKKAWLPPNFFFVSIALAKICFLRIVINHTRILLY